MVPPITKQEMMRLELAEKYPTEKALNLEEMMS